MHRKTLAPLSETPSEPDRADILCQFCNIHFVLLNHRAIEADRILGAVVLSYPHQIRSEIENDVPITKKEEKSTNSYSWDDPKFTIRQRQVISLLITGETNKNIALILGLSRRAVEHHRYVIMKKTDSKSFPALVGITIAAAESFARRQTELKNISSLTPRQLHIMGLVLTGKPSKIIAAELNISQRTVENHRYSILKKTGARSLSALACLALTVT